MPRSRPTIRAEIREHLLFWAFATEVLVVIFMAWWNWPSVQEWWFKSVNAGQTIPKLLNYQARVTDSAGTAVADGALNVKISVYDAASGGTCLYTIRGTCGTPTSKSVTVTSGVFSTVIGDTVAGDNVIPDTLFDNAGVYLGITVGSDPDEMVPRKRLTSGPYAFNADRLDNLDSSNAGGTGAYIPATDATGGLLLTGLLRTAGQVVSPTSNLFQVQNSIDSGRYFTVASTSTLVGVTPAGAAITGYKVGIGTGSPNSRLDVTSAGTGGEVMITTGNPITPADLGWTLGTGERINILNGGPTGGCCSYSQLVVTNSKTSPVAGDLMGAIAWGIKSTGSIDTYSGVKAQILAYAEGSGGGTGGLGGNMILATRTDNGALTERLRISNTGNVGINDTNPLYRLSVANASGVAARITSGDTTGTVATLLINNSGSSFGLPVISLTRAGALMGDLLGYDSDAFGLVNGITLSAATGKSIGFRVGGSTEAARFNSSGRFGIGTTNPYAAKLHVDAATVGGVGGAAFLTNTAAATYGNRARLGFDLIGFEDIIPTATIDGFLANSGSGATDLVFNAYDGSGTLTNYERMRLVGASGNLGVGTAFPTARLTISASTTSPTTNLFEIQNSINSARYFTVSSTATISDVNFYVRNNDTNAVIARAFPRTGSGKNRAIDFYDSSDITNSSGLFIGLAPTSGWIHTSLTGSFIQSYKNGTGTARPLYLMASSDVFNATPNLTLLTSGNVGVGTTTPDSLFEIEGAFTSSSEVFRITDSTASSGFLKLLDGTSVGSQFVPMIHGRGVGTGAADRAGLYLLADAGEDGSDDAAVLIQGRNASGGALTTASILKVRNSAGTNLLSVGPTGLVDVVGGGLISHTSSDSAGFYSTAYFSNTTYGVMTQADRELRIQGGGNAGGQRYQYLTFNGRWSGNIDSPTLTQGLYDRVSAIEFAAAADSLGPNPNSSINFIVNTGTKSTGSELVVTPTRAMTIAYTGRIGIGTTDPSELLHVRGSGAAKAIKVETTSSHAAFLEAADGTGRRVRLQANVADVFVGTITSHDLNIVTNGASVGTFTTGGNFGIGTSSPDARLDVESSHTDHTTSFARLTNTSATGQTPLDFYINGTLRGKVRADFAGNMNFVSNGGGYYWYTGGDSGTGQARMVFTSGGDLGVGMLTPSARLTVADGLVSPTANIFEVQNSINSARYFSVSATNTTFGYDSASTTNSVGFRSGINSNLVPLTDNLYSLGEYNRRWKDLWLSGGSANIAFDQSGTTTMRLGFESTAGLRGYIATPSGIPLQLRSSIGTTTGGLYIDPSNRVIIGATDLVDSGNTHLLEVGDGVARFRGKTSGSYSPIAYFGGRNTGSGNYTTLEVGKTADTSGDLVFMEYHAGTIVTAPKIHFSSFAADPTTTAKMTIDILNGRVGIGTTGPLSKLDVNGGVAVGTYAGNNAAPSNGLIVSGNVGIGTTSVTSGSQLDVAGRIRTTSDILSVGGGGQQVWKDATPTKAINFGMTVPGGSLTDDLQLSTYSAPTWTGRLTILSASGNVGIGSTSPDAKLDVETSNTDLNTSFARLTNTSAVGQTPLDFYINGTLRGKYRVDYVGGTYFVTNGGDFNWSTGGDVGTGTTRMTLMADGRLGIGTTAPSARLTVADASGSPAGTIFEVWNNGGSSKYLTVSSTETKITGTSVNATTPDTANTVLRIRNNRTTTGANPAYVVAIARQNSNTPAWYFGNDGDSNGVIVTNNADLRFGRDSGGTFSEYLRMVNGTGRFGIGTSAPQNLLDVEGGAAIGAGYSGTTAAPTNGLIVEGNVGIGSNNPSTQLHLLSSGDNALQVETSGNNVTGIELKTDSSADWQIAAAGTGASTPNTLYLFQRGVNMRRWTINSSGNMGFGPSATNAPARLVVADDAGSPTGNIFEVWNNGGSNKYLTVSSTSTITTGIGGITFKTSNASAGFSIFDRSSVPGDQMVFQGNTGNYTLFNVATKNADIGTEKVSGIAFWTVDNANTANATQFQIQNSVTYDPVIFTQKFGTGAQGDKKISLQTVWNQSTTPTQLVLDTNGQVGIGTASPAQKLHVSAGDIRIDNNRFLRTRNAADSADAYLIGMNTSNLVAIDGTGYGATTGATLTTGGLLTVGGNIKTTGGTGIIAVRPSTGSLDMKAGAIGFTRPDLASETVFAGISPVFDGTSGGAWYNGAALAFYTASGADISGGVGITEKMRISGSGSVGIGTTAPGARLVVSASETSPTFNLLQLTNINDSVRYFTVSSTSTHLLNEVLAQGDVSSGSALDIADVFQAGTVRKNFAPQTDTLGDATTVEGTSWGPVAYPSVITWTTSSQVSPRGVSETVGQLTSTSGDGGGADYRTELTSANTGISDTRGMTFTASVWMKTASGSASLNLSMARYADNESTGTTCVVNSSTWKRCTYTKTMSATSYADNSEIRVYLTGFVTGTTHYVYGAQVERNSYASAYQKNSGASTGSGTGMWAGTLGIGNTMQAPSIFGDTNGLTVANSAVSPTTNIFQVQNSIDSARYLTVSSTATLIGEGATLRVGTSSLGVQVTNFQVNQVEAASNLYVNAGATSGTLFLRPGSTGTLYIEKPGGTRIFTADMTSGFIGIGTTSPAARLTVADASGTPTGNIFEVWNNGGSSKYLTVSSTATTVANLTVTGTCTGCGAASGDITVVGSMLSGDVFADSTADDDWLGLGASAGRIEFDDQATDEVNVLSANFGIGTQAPISQLHVPGRVPTAKTGALTSGTNLSGMHVQGRYAYVASNGDNTFRVFDVSNPSSPSAIASLSVGSGPDGVHVQGRYAYLTEITNGVLRIIDISHPTAPVSVGTVSVSSADQVYVQGRYAYVTNQGGATFHVIDVASSTAPVQVGSVGVGSALRSVFVQGKYAYVTSSGDNTLRVIDVSNPASPANVGSVSTGSTPFTVYVQGRYAYVANLSSNSIQIVDVATSTAPVVVSTFTTSVSGPRAIRVEGRYAYFLNQGNNTLQVVDVSNPSSPTNVGTVSTASAGRSLYVSGRFAYAGNDATVGNTFEVFDVGGSYIQQFEVGGVEAGTVHVRDFLDALDGNFAGGLGVGSNAIIGGDFSVSGQSAFMNRVGIGTTTPGKLLDVQGFFELDIDGTNDNTVGVCKDVSDTTGTEADVHFNDCNGTPGDIAEWYPVTGTPTAGYIVETTTETMAFQSDMMDPKTGMNLHRKQDHVVSVLRKSSGPYATNIIGVISTSPVSSFGMGVNDTSSSTAPVALIGRVPLKVVAENGPIAVGDPITTSSTPGVGMKATRPGRIVGIALNVWDGEGVGEIEVFTNPGWYNGPTPASGVSVLGSRLTVENDAIMDYQRSTITNVAAIISSSGLWSVTEDGYLIAQHIETKELKTEKMTISNAGEAKTAGSGVIEAGKLWAVVQNPEIKPTSLVMVTFEDNPGSYWWISSKQDGQFTLQLGQAAQANSRFIYWLVGVDGELTAATAPPPTPPPPEPSPPPEQEPEPDATDPGPTDPGPTDSSTSTPETP
jgi:hypothetical protein